MPLYEMAANVLLSDVKKAAVSRDVWLRSWGCSYSRCSYSLYEWVGTNDLDGGLLKVLLV